MHMQYVFVCVGIMYILHDSVHVWFQCKISITSDRNTDGITRTYFHYIFCQVWILHCKRFLMWEGIFLS